MKFFFDNCVSPAIVAAVAAIADTQRIAHARIELEHLRARFDPSAPDEEWLGKLKGEGCVVLSGDGRMLRKGPVRKAWIEAGLTTFFFEDAWSARSIWIQAEAVMSWMPQIIRTARDCGPGCGFKLTHRSPSPILVYPENQMWGSRD